MKCQEYENLERQFIEVRTKIRKVRHLDPETLEDADRKELRALLRLLDHRTEHHCQPTGE